MTIPGSANPLLLKSAAAGPSYQVQRSLRFNSSDSAFLSRTPASAGNRKTFTFSAWIKRCRTLNGIQTIFSSSSEGQIRFENDAILILHVGEAALTTSAVFRDLSAWGHLVVAFDTTQATASNRIRLYWNGAALTQFSSSNYPALDALLPFNEALTHAIGRRASSGAPYLDAYLADIHFIDGQALTPSSFAETNATTGQWVPKAYSGSYGTNGFQLKFADNSAATAAALGKDTSGNGNNWTPNNLSVTAGAGNNSLVDTPTSYGTDTGAGGEVRGNYATLNPLDQNLTGNGTISNGNLQYVQSSTGGRTGRATIGVSSGKWYWELTADNSGNSNVGVTRNNSNLGVYVGADANGWGYVASGNKSNNGESAYGSSWTTGDVIGVALDMDAGTIVFYKNNISQGTAFSGLSGTLFPSVGTSNVTTCSFTINFGQRPFAYTAPSGFKALCDTNLPAPTIAKGNAVMDVALYTGNGGTRTVSGLGFSPDFVWVKERNGTSTYAMWDQVRGASKLISSNVTAAEDTTNALSLFNADGFTVVYPNTNDYYVNRNSQTYVAWCWDAGSSTVTNTQGSITSQVRANASAGFSVCTFSLTTANSISTFGHGLGVSPEFVIIKPRNTSTDWAVFHNASGASPLQARMLLNSTAARNTYGFDVWSRSSTTLGVYSTILAAPGTAIDCVAYCFAPVAGYSSFGSYTGNGSSDGPFVYTGFRPRWIVFKRTDTSSDWILLDTSRSPFNVSEDLLFPNNTSAEFANDAYTLVDFTANGFKVKSSGSFGINQSGSTWIYAAFAENPFQYARAR